MEIVTVKNGTEVPDVVVRTTMLALRLMLSSDPIAFYELVESCRDQMHVVFGGRPTGFGLMNSVDAEGHGVVHDAVRNIVLSAVTGDNFDMQLADSPL